MRGFATTAQMVFGFVPISVLIADVVQRWIISKIFGKVDTESENFIFQNWRGLPTFEFEESSHTILPLALPKHWFIYIYYHIIIINGLPLWLSLLSYFHFYYFIIILFSSPNDNGHYHHFHLELPHYNFSFSLLSLPFIIPCSHYFIIFTIPLWIYSSSFLSSDLILNPSLHSKEFQSANLYLP